jgi:organic hydroperoxide reductase OsmC/OhrA
MPTITAEFRTIPGTEAAEGTCGGRTVIVDRPDGVAGGEGSGFNGGQLFALAIGGCLANDLRYVAHSRSVPLADLVIAVDVEIEDGVVTGARARVAGADEELVREAVGVSTIVRAVREGVPVTVH